MNLKLITDSSANLRKLDGIPFSVTPLKIITAEKEYIDDETTDAAEMTADLAAYKGRSSTSCPNATDWAEAFGNAENIICITITSTLSGSYASALAAKSAILEQFPTRNIYVLDSGSTGPEMQLLLEKAKELSQNTQDFSEICKKLEEYKEKTELLFVLSSMKNLANNGRVSHTAAKLAGLLGIRAIGRASEQGDLQLLTKSRGEKKALQFVLDFMQQAGYRGGKVRIAHCLNEDAASSLRQMLQHTYRESSVEILPCTALCSFYAESGGLLIGFEKD